MGLSLSSYSLWMLSFALEACLCVLFSVRGLHRRFPIFAVYIYCQIFTAFLDWIVFRKYGFWSRPAYIVAWTTAGAVMLTEWLLTVEVCRRGWRDYRGIWALTWRFLAALFAVFLFHALYALRDRPGRIDPLILVLHRDLALASAVVLVAILVLERHYQIDLGRIERWVAVGLAAYFVTAVLSDALLIQWVLNHWPMFSGHPPSAKRLEIWWNGIRLAVFDMALASWCFVLRKPLPAPKPAPVLLPPEIYGELVPAIHSRLDALNSRLLDLLKA